MTRTTDLLRALDVATAELQRPDSDPMSEMSATQAAVRMVAALDAAGYMISRDHRKLMAEGSGIPDPGVLSLELSSTIDVIDGKLTGPVIELLMLAVQIEVAVASSHGKMGG
jgi:hypothetical protein